MSIILSISFSIVLIVYARYIEISAMLLRWSWQIVERGYVFSRRRPLNDRSAEHDVAGMVVKMQQAL